VVFKHFPLNFHESAKPAAIAAVAAQEQGRFWEFHDVVFKNQATLSQESLESFAQQAGLDVERFKSDLAKNGADYAKRVDEDYEQGTTVDVRGTPTLYINGRKVQDRSIEGMSAMVEAALGGAS
jgi:protein-disulfide isomerase